MVFEKDGLKLKLAKTRLLGMIWGMESLFPVQSLEKVGLLNLAKEGLRVYTCVFVYYCFFYEYIMSKNNFLSCRTDHCKLVRNMFGLELRNKLLTMKALKP